MSIRRGRFYRPRCGFDLPVCAVAIGRYRAAGGPAWVTVDERGAEEVVRRLRA